MTVDKRRIGTVRESRKYIAGNVVCQWCSLVANIVMMTALASLLAALLTDASAHVMPAVMTACLALAVRFLCAIGSARMSYLSSRAVKRTLRERIYAKLLRLGVPYPEQAATSEVVQVAVVCVDHQALFSGANPAQVFFPQLYRLARLPRLRIVPVR